MPQHALCCVLGMLSCLEVKVSTSKVEVKVSKNARAIGARRDLKEAWSERASRWTKTGYKTPAPDQRATYREVHIHQRREEYYSALQRDSYSYLSATIGSTLAARRAGR